MPDNVSPEQPDQATPPVVGTQPEPHIPTTANEPTGGTVKGHGLRNAVLAILVLAILGGGGAYGYMALSRHHTTVAAKKDIPLISYALSDGDLSTTFPQAVDTTSNALANAQLYEGLVRYQDQNKIVPLLSTGWTNPDNTTWLFTIRQNVKFHSGRTLTATDVAYSLNYAVAHQDDDNGDLALALASTIKTVTAVSDYQVKITTDGPDPTLLNRLTQLYILDSKGTLGDFNDGTGPYMLPTGSKPTPSSITLAASDNYWGGHVYTRSLHLSTVADNDARAKEAASGQVDIAGDLTSAQANSTKASQILQLEDYGATFLGLNANHVASPLHYLAARQAVTAAINVPAVLKAAGIDGKQLSQLIPSEIPGYNPAIPDATFDLDKAKQLLATVPNASAPIAFSYIASDSKAALEVVKELQAAGFNIKAAQSTDLNALVGAALSGKTDMYDLTYGSDIFDGLDIITSVVTGNANYTSSAVEALADQASSTLDPTSRINLLQQIEKQVSTDIPDVPLYNQTRYCAVMKPYHLSVDIPGTGIGVYFWKVYQ